MIFILYLKYQTIYIKKIDDYRGKFDIVKRREDKE